MKTGRELRREFIEFFERECGHAFVASSPLLPAEDPTLLFANAGMNQFKPLFLGTETRDYTRAANTQKCIRAGGKHNDLDDVGRDCYHHTFFEMLGNWSFGDYFKQEAIDWAWRLLTEVWGLQAERLHATWFEGDDSEGLEPDIEARDLWKKYLPEERIHPGNKKDNFWEMGDTGPCGPCSEVHIDLTEDMSGGPLVNAGDPRVMELWNLVFIQFNRTAERLDPLPAKHVDTGMGLERLAAVVQGRKSNYATDLFIPIIEKIEEISGKSYGDSEAEGANRYDVMDEENLIDVSMRVIADHIRSLVFAITDGIRISNEGRGYVLRSILRRAAGFGRQHLGIEGTFLHRLVPTVVEQFSDAFPELTGRQEAVRKEILSEEEGFSRTLEKGLDLFGRTSEKIKSEGRTEISGSEAFELHATYGFPISLTKLMAEKAGLSVDEAAFDREMNEHRQTSRADGSAFKIDMVVGLPETDDSARYETDDIDATVLGWVQGDAFVDQGQLDEGAEAAVILDRTNFYGESGGQVGDCGTLMGDTFVFEVRDTQLAGGSVLHVGQVRMGTIEPGMTVTASVGEDRLDTMRNHTATHLLNWALREVLDPNGGTVEQAGSVVAPDRLRFDFTYGQALTSEQLSEIERLVNGRILHDGEVVTSRMPLDEAMKVPGVRAVFGEKYPDPVRVVRVGGALNTDLHEYFSAEFCGGTHLDSAGKIGLFKIISEESVARGVRRITAITGIKAVEWVLNADRVLRGVSESLSVPPEEVPGRIESMQKEIKKLRKQSAAGGGEVTESQELETSLGRVMVARAGSADPGVMRGICDQQRQKGASAVFLAGADEETNRVMMVAMVDDRLVESGKLLAGDWVREIAPIVGGGGGGKPRLAQAGGKQPENLSKALAGALQYAGKQLED